MHDDPNPIDITVGRNLRTERKAQGATQEQLADALGITFQQVQKYERGANRVSASKLVLAARFLKIPVAQLFHGVEDVEGESQATAVDAFVMAPGGLELMQLFMGMPADFRQALLRTAKALNDCKPEPWASKTGGGVTLGELRVNLAPLSAAEAAAVVGAH